MDKIDIPDDLMVVLENLKESAASIKNGLDHFAERLNQHSEVFWKTVKEALPELQGWVVKIDYKTKQATKLCKEKD